METVTCTCQDCGAQMDYKEALAYYDEIAGRGIVPGLGKIRALTEALGSPQEQTPVVHIAGTNGKGSVGAMLAAMLSLSGQKVGRFVSPAVFGPREAWQIYAPGSGEASWITEEEFASLTAVVREADEKHGIEATPFEVQTALAYLYFTEQNCDIALVEAGMGGRLDATNVIRRPKLSVITSLSMDHMAYLGDTRAEIAGEKAGIIKEGVPVATVSQKREAADVIRRTCAKMHAPLTVARKDEIRGVKTVCTKDALVTKMRYCGREYELSLAGVQQTENAALAIEAARILGVREDAIAAGLARTVWPGRMELIRVAPALVLDGAHNEDAAKRLAENLRRYFPGRKILFCMGAFKDKEVSKELAELRGAGGRLFAFTTVSARAMDAEKLAMLAGEAGFAAEAAGSPTEAVGKALLEAGAEDVVVCCGSLSFLGEIRQAFLA